MRAWPLVLTLFACKPTDLDAAIDCDTPCPAGTAVATSQQVSVGYDVDAAVDPATYSGEVGFKSFREGGCEWACATIQGCPEETFPVITTDCFTCGAIVDGEVLQGTCDQDGGDA